MHGLPPAEGESVPEWYILHLMGKTYGQSPWLLEPQLSAQWFDRFALVTGAEAECDNPKRLV